MEYYYEEPSNLDDFEMFEYYNQQPIEQPRQSVKIERVSPTTIQKRRPGRAPARPDEELDAVEFERRLRRRECNRNAAVRCRNRRIEKVTQLQGQVAKLTSAKVELEQKNQTLQSEVKRLQFQLNVQRPIDNCEQTSSIFDDEPFPALNELENFQVDQSYAVTITPLALDKSFEFPALSNDTILKMRNESFTEFNKFLSCL